MKKWFSILNYLAVCICILCLRNGVEVKAASEKVMGVVQTGDSTDSVAIAWEQMDNAFGYQVEYCENDSFSGGAYGVKSVAATAQSVQISGLSAGKSYYIRVWMLDETGNRQAVSDKLEAVTAPEGVVENLVQTNGKDSSTLSCSWDRAVGANAYRLDWITHDYSTKTWGVWTIQPMEDINTWQLPAKQDTGYAIHIFKGLKSADGYVAYADQFAEVFLYPVPSKVTKVQMLVSGIHRFWPEEGSVRFGWNPSIGAEGYEYVVYGYHGKKLFSGTTKEYRNVWVQHEKLTNDQFMKIKVRAYNTVDGKRRYGEWSEECYFAKCLRNVRISKKEDGLRIAWSKTKGAKNYTVYASVKQNSGYKKLGTTSKNRYQIKKVNGRKLVRGKVYYFKVIANKKVGKKRYSSDQSWYFSRVY